MASIAQHMVPLNREAYKKQKRSLAAVFYVLSPFFVFDWIEFFGRFHAPEALGRFACTALPFAKLSTPLVSHRLADFAQAQCATQVHEPALSIIFYMLKMAIAMTVAVGMTTWIYFIPVCFLPPRLKTMRSETFIRITTQIEHDGGVVAQITKSFPLIFCLLSFCLVAVYHNEHISHFGVAPLDKFIEDVLCLTVFVTALILVLCLSSWTFYGLKRIKFSPKQ